MRSGPLVLVDWTRGAARAAVFRESVSGWQMEHAVSMPPRLVVRQEERQAEGAQTPSTRVLFGGEAMEAREDSSTLIFEEPARDLPRMEDEELQTLLMDGFWRATGQELSAGGHLRAGETEAAGYVVTPHRFPLPLLESFRASCAGASPIKLVGSVQEGAALLLGFLRSEAFRPEETIAPSDAPTTICLVVACDAETIDILCFDYSLETPVRHRALIRDFFQTTCADVSKRLHDCDWLGAFSLLVIVEDPALTEAARAALGAPLQAIAYGVASQRRQLQTARELKILGGAQMALCAMGRAPDEREYDIAHACHIGLQIDQQHFEPIIGKDEWARLKEFPHWAAQAFRLRGSPGNALRLNLYSGYSTRMADAVLVGHTMLWHEDLARLQGAGALAAVVRLDAPGSGEFLIGLMPENRALRRQTFTLPGLMV